MNKNVSDNKLLKKSKDLENEVLQLRQLATILMDRTGLYQTIFNTCPFGIVITDLEFKFHDANSAFLAMIQYESVDELKECDLEELVPSKYRCDDKKRTGYVDSLYKEGIVEIETTIQSSDGNLLPVKLTACVTDDDQGNPKKVAGFIADRKHLVHYDSILKQKDQEIQYLKKSLEEQKDFHKSILEQAKKNQKDMEDSIVLNVKEMVFPYLNKLQQTTDLSDHQNEYIKLLKTQLYNIISPFYSELSSKYSNLTPMEFRIAGLVKEGRTTKDIAKLLNLSAGTVEFHRNNLRKKLGIRNTNVNLRLHLLAME